MEHTKLQTVVLDGWMKDFNGKGEKAVLHDTLKSYFDAVWHEADGYWSDKIKDHWDHAEKLYQDNYGFPFRRYNWQSKMKSPVVDNLITRISYHIYKVLVNIAAGRYFTVDHPNEARAKAYEELLKLDLKRENYPKKFIESFAQSLLNSIMVHKIVYAKTVHYIPTFNQTLMKYDKLEPKVKATVQIQKIDPRNIRLDPMGDRYIIECVNKVPWHEFLHIARANKWKNVHAIEKELDNKDQHLPTVDLKYVYCKSLVDEKGKEISTNVYFVVAEDKYVVHVDNYLLPDGRFPYSVGAPMMDVYGRYGRSYVSKVADIITHHVGFQNLTLDAAQLSALGTHEYDIEVASSDSAHTFTSGVSPGKMFPKVGQGKMLNSAYPDANQIPGLLQIGYYLDRELQNKGYVNEFFAGQATAKGRPTLGEINLKTQESSAFFTDMASHVESNKISQDLELILFTRLLHLHENRDDLQSEISHLDPAIQDTIRQLTPEVIMDDLMNFRITVHGVSGKLQKQANFEKFIAVWQVLGNMPLVQGTAIFSKITKEVLELLDDSADSLVNIELMEDLEKKMQENLAMQIAGAGQQNQAPAGPQGGQPANSPTPAQDTVV